MVNFENIDKATFYGVGPYEIPSILPETDIPIHKIQWMPFSDAMRCKDPTGKGIHFYVDDYRFARVWNDPDRYIPILQRFDAVCSPDFSQYTDIPVAMRIYNHYRKHWLAAYWQMHGIRVIPTICWSDRSSYDWCFDGEPDGGIISISSVGTQKREDAKDAFADGCREALRRLNPKQILWYGRCPDEFDWNVVKIKPHYDEIVERRRLANGR